MDISQLTESDYQPSTASRRALSAACAALAVMVVPSLLALLGIHTYDPTAWTVPPHLTAGIATLLVVVLRYAGNLAEWYREDEHALQMQAFIDTAVAVATVTASALVMSIAYT
jgi:hypothetical protein